MKYSLLLVAFLSTTALIAEEVHIETVHTEAVKALPQTTVNVTCPEKSQEVDDLSSQIETLEMKLDEVAQKAEAKPTEEVLEEHQKMVISVVGQGVAPMNTSSPAQAYALAKRAAVSDAYRLIAEKVKGVRVDGQDVIKNMMVKRSTVRTSVNAMVRNANVVETTFKEGLCEVEMEIVIAHSQFAQ